MSRATAALIGCWLSLCFLNSAAGMAAAAQGVHHAPLVLASNHTKDTQKEDGAQSGTRKAAKPGKEPARQVPVEPFEEPAKDEPETEPEKPSKDAADKKPADKPGAESNNKALKKVPEKSADTPAAKAGEEKPEKKTEAGVKKGSSAKEVGMTGPGLPVRKPRKPVFRKKKETKRTKKYPPPPSSARNKKLCKALQKCRNEFVTCKGKIKHPDQSEPWIIAKEVCGGYYKTCVEKDFQAGEWFMTRWFYFQELNCGG